MGRARRAQDLLLQTIRENRVALAVVAEPYRVPDAPNWIGDLDGSTAITWMPALSSPGALLERGNGYVAVEWNRIAVVGVYISPNSGVAAFEDFLDRAGDCVRRCFPRQVIVLGDFNAHSSQWGDARTDTRGRALIDWAAGLGLLLANRGTASTCVAWRGSSVVDVTWATADLYRRIRGWRVADRMETLSDHLHNDGDGAGWTTGREPFPPTATTDTEVAPEGEGQRDVARGSYRFRLELGRTDDDDHHHQCRRGGGGALGIHESGVRRLDAALRAGR